jgi:hypothetical protein
MLQLMHLRFHRQSRVVKQSDLLANESPGRPVQPTSAALGADVAGRVRSGLHSKSLVQRFKLAASHRTCFAHFHCEGASTTAVSTQCRLPLHRRLTPYTYCLVLSAVADYRLQAPLVRSMSISAISSKFQSMSSLAFARSTNLGIEGYRVTSDCCCASAGLLPDQNPLLLFVETASPRVNLSLIFAKVPSIHRQNTTIAGLASISDWTRQ